MGEDEVQRSDTAGEWSILQIFNGKEVSHASIFPHPAVIPTNALTPDRCRGAQGRADGGRVSRVEPGSEETCVQGARPAAGHALRTPSKLRARWASCQLTPPGRAPCSALLDDWLFCL